MGSEINESQEKATLSNGVLAMASPALWWRCLNASLRYLILRSPRTPVIQSINGILFEFDFDLDPLVKVIRCPKLLREYLGGGLEPIVLAMYYGGYEPSVVQEMRNLLKRGDTFIDVGASIGYLSAFAMGFVGRSGEVHSFEPLPQYYKHLIRLASANKAYTIKVNQCALGDREGTATIQVTTIPNLGASFMIPGLRRKRTVEGRLLVPVRRLDRYIEEEALKEISVIKIDVEGFEFPVLKGLSGYLEQSKNPPSIICEIMPAAYSLMNHTLGELAEYMGQYGYQTLNLSKNHTQVELTRLTELTTVLFKPSV